MSKRGVVSERVGVVGAGRLGAVAAACLAELGHSVCAVDVDEATVATLRKGEAPFYEPELAPLLKRNLEACRLSFTTAFSEAIPSAGFVVLCVGTPPRSDGGADLSPLHAAIRELAPLLAEHTTIVTRSTVPVGTNASLAQMIRDENPHAAFDIVSNPEFLREGHAVGDFLRPDRIVIGADSERAAKSVARLYTGIDAPVVSTNLETAEMSKYAANAYLAASISFINEIANLCEQVGADVTQVARTLALDSRIGEQAYLTPGIGFGGGCLPKDLQALIATAERQGYNPALLRAIGAVNELQAGWVVARLTALYEDLSSLTVAVLGLSFKANTFDLRSSPALTVVRHLAERGVRVRTFDPLADEAGRKEVASYATFCPDAYSAAEGCHALVVATDHAAFQELDLARLGRAMASRVLIDGRNLYDPTTASEAGFSYAGIGRGRRAD